MNDSGVNREKRTTKESILALYALPKHPASVASVPTGTGGGSLSPSRSCPNSQLLMPCSWMILYLSLDLKSTSTFLFENIVKKL